ncbi:2-amino-4-hydroxy-6-hydroxymethyldihydropteridine diphosphokinase [Psychroflexus sp. MBR-150]
MSTLTSVYIALGSNQGQREVYLQKAIEAIFTKIGSVTHISSVYETPAWGFEGEAFYNACIKVKTRLKAQQVLKELQEIEITLGRRRHSKRYQNRTIDLDILFFGDDYIADSNLKIPHPELSKRDFVLFPLADIATQKTHPILNQNIEKLKDDLPKNNTIKKTDVKLKPVNFKVPDVNYICIEGNIGAGKTTFVEMMAEDFDAKLILERFKENPFLPQFYKDPKRYAFPTEMSFLADRHQQLVDDITQLDLFSNFSIADYDLYKSLIFARITLKDQEFKLYKKVFDIMYRNITKPDLYVYFYQNTERLLENIHKRGRSYEQDINADYLEKINQGYLNFIKNENRFKTKILDISELDFVDKREDYLKLVGDILNF